MVQGFLKLIDKAQLSCRPGVVQAYTSVPICNPATLYMSQITSAAAGAVSAAA